MDVAARSNNGRSCPAGLICPSHGGYVEFRYTVGDIPQTPPTVTQNVVFQNGVSQLWQDQNWGRANLKVCANNLAGNTVYVYFNRNGRSWTYNQRATNNCVIFWDMDGAGPLNRSTTYYSRAALNQQPNPSWPIPCAGPTGGQGLCAWSPAHFSFHQASGHRK